jgi:hypothetical protein
MISRQVRRPVAFVLAICLTISTGGAGGRTALDRADLLDPDPAQSYLVTTKDGRELTFISLHLEGDWLVGTVRITTSEVEGEGEDARTSVTNRYEEMRLPWSEVAGVEADVGKKGGSGFLLAGGAIVVGVAAFLLLTGGSDDEPTDNGGKGGP